MNIEIVAAVARNRVIGLHNKLPWSLPEDFAHFRALTTGHSVIMGANTWKGMRHPLRDRQNIVVAQNLVDPHESIYIAHDFQSALKLVHPSQTAFAIGGAQIYADALNLAQHMHITEIHQDFDGDVFFPKFDLSEWSETCRKDGNTTGNHAFSYDFVKYVRT